MVRPDDIQHFFLITTINLFGSWSIARFSVHSLSWALQESLRTCFSWPVSKILCERE